MVFKRASRLTFQKWQAQFDPMLGGLPAARILICTLLSMLAAICQCSAQPTQPQVDTNAPAFKRIKLFDLKKDGAYVFAFCPASRDLFVSFDEEHSQIVHRWNLDTGRKLDSYAFPKAYRCDQAVVSPDGKTLVLVAYDMFHDALHKADKVRLVDVQRGKLIKELIYDGTPARVEFSRDGKFIVTRKYTYELGGELVYDLGGNEQKSFDLKLFDPARKPAVWEVPNSKGGPLPGLFCHAPKGEDIRLYPSADTHWSDAGDIVVSADDRFVACSTGKGRLMIWRLSDAKLVFEANVGKRWFPLAYDPNENRFLFADNDVDKMTSLQAVELETAK